MGGQQAVRIGVLGGTFDPIHIGHLVAAEEVRWALGLDKVLFVPASTPPHKVRREISPAKERVRMVELAIASNPFFELSLVDINRPGVSYTVDTMQTLQGELGPSVDLFFIIGMDSLPELPTWRDPGRLIQLCRLAVVNRPPYPAADLRSLEATIAGISQRVHMVPMPGIYVSSTDLQSRVRRGLPIRYQVVDSVESYIREKGLYAKVPGGDRG